MRDLKPVRVFLEVVRLQSFAAAAKSMRMTPASVTRIVAKLEEDLGEQLLLRTTRQVSLTSTGALVAARYQPLVEAFDQVEQELQREIQPYRGKLSVNAPMSFGLRIMPELVDGFRMAFPNIDLNIRLTDRLVDVVSENCDLAIRISEPPRDKSTIWRKLCAVPRMVVASPELLERHPKPLSPEDLDHRLCFSYGEADKPEVWQFQQGAIKRPFTAGRTLHSNNGDLLYKFAHAGSGIVMLPKFIVSQGVQAGEVVHLLQDWTLPPLWLSLYYPPYEALPPLVATFTDYFEAYLRDREEFRF